MSRLRSGGGGMVFAAGGVFALAMAFNSSTITRVEAPELVYQVQLLGRIMYICPERFGRTTHDIDCGRWLRRTAAGTTVFVQPSGQPVTAVSEVN